MLIAKPKKKMKMIKIKVNYIFIKTGVKNMVILIQKRYFFKLVLEKENVHNYIFIKIILIKIKFINNEY